MIKINVKEKIIEASKILDDLEEYDSGLSESLSKVDSKICDLMHLIECNKLKTNQCYRVIQELHKLRLERRKIKNDIELMNAFKQHQNKLLNLENRKILLSFIGKTDKALLNSKYNNRVYTEDELNELIGV